MRSGERIERVPANAGVVIVSCTSISISGYCSGISTGRDRQLTVKREPSFHAAPYDLCSIPRLMGETDMKHESSRQKLAPVYVGFTFHVGSRFTSNVKHKLSCVNQHET